MEEDNKTDQTLFLAQGGLSRLVAYPDYLLYENGQGWILPTLIKFQRFRWEDIESITRRSRSRLGHAVFWVILFLLFGGIAFALAAAVASGGPTLWPVFWLIFFTAISLFALSRAVSCLAKGPSYQVHLATRHSRQELRCLARAAEASRVVQFLDERVREVQAGEGGSGEDDRATGVSLIRSVPKILFILFFGLVLCGGLVAFGMYSGSGLGGALIVMAGLIALILSLIGGAIGARKLLPPMLTIWLRITRVAAFLAVICLFSVGGVMAGQEPELTIGGRLLPALGEISSRGGLSLIFTWVASALLILPGIGAFCGAIAARGRATKPARD